MRFAYLALLGALSFAAPALADEDGPMTTAPAAAVAREGAAPQPSPPVSDPATLSVADQIDAFLRTSPARDVATDDDLAERPRDRKVHGEMSVGVGTHGYRSLYARADIPLGERGFLSIAVEDSRGPAAYGRDPFYGGYGLSGYGFGGARDLRGCGLEGLTPPRPLDDLGGPNGRCAGPAYARPAN